MVVGRGCRGEGQRLPQFQFEAIPKFWSRAASKVEQWECASRCKPVLLRRRKPVNFIAGPCADGQLVSGFHQHTGRGSLL